MLKYVVIERNVFVEFRVIDFIYLVSIDVVIYVREIININRWKINIMLFFKEKCIMGYGKCLL